MVPLNAKHLRVMDLYWQGAVFLNVNNLSIGSQGSNHTLIENLNSLKYTSVKIVVCIKMKREREILTLPYDSTSHLMVSQWYSVSANLTFKMSFWL